MSYSLLRKICTNPYFSFFICSLFILSTSCKNADISSLNPDYTGEELFKGIVFSEGEVIERIPEIKEYYSKAEKLIESKTEADASIPLKEIS